MKILIISENAAILETFKTLLSDDLGLSNVHMASTVEEADTLFTGKNSFDLCISDYYVGEELASDLYKKLSLRFGKGIDCNFLCIAGYNTLELNRFPFLVEIFNSDEAKPIFERINDIRIEYVDKTFISGEILPEEEII